MAIAIDPERAHRYTLPADRSKECATVFFIKPLTGPDARVAMRVEGSEDMAALIYDIVLMTLVGWEGFLLGDGTEVPFELEERLVQGKRRKVPNEASMRRLDALTISELAQAAMDFSRLTAGEAKN